MVFYRWWIHWLQMTILWILTRIDHHNIAFWEPEDLNKDVLQSFPVIFDVKILRKNWPARHPTISHTALINIRWVINISDERYIEWWLRSAQEISTLIRLDLMEIWMIRFSYDKSSDLVRIDLVTAARLYPRWMHILGLIQYGGHLSNHYSMNKKNKSPIIDCTPLYPRNPTPLWFMIVPTIEFCPVPESKNWNSLPGW